MASRLFKSGNALCLIIPRAVARRYHLEAGVEVEVVPEEEGILLQPLGVAPWFSLEWERALDAVMEWYRPALEQIGAE